MTHHDDFIDRLESYLDDADGYTPLPGAVRNAVRASLPTIKQSRPHRGRERFASMTVQLPAPARYGLTAAAVLLAVVLGAGLFTDNRDTGGAPAASAKPSVPPSAEGAVSLTEVAEVGDLTPRRYLLDVAAFPARIEFEVPAGWWHWWSGSRPVSDVQAILVNSLYTGATNGSAWGLSFTVVDEVSVDPCDREAGTMDPSATESADSLATAFSSWADYPATSVEDVTIGGYPAKRVEIAMDASPCSGTLFTTPSGYAFTTDEARSGAPAPPQQFTFVDVDGSVLVIWTTDYPSTNYFELDGGASFDPEAHVYDQVELHAILDSIVIQPRPTPSD